MEKTFIDYLKLELKALDESGEDFDRTIMHFPDIIGLLCDLLEEDIVDRNSRLMINAALGYLLVPNDVVPEDVYGAYGYMDDMYISCLVLKTLKVKYSELVNRLWGPGSNYTSNDNNLDEILDLCIFNSEKFLDSKNLKEKVLKYCGLSEE